MTKHVEFAPGAKGYLAAPAAVVVIQEWWGLVPHIEDVTRRFARLGYTALAPDLYHGKSTVEAKEAQHLLEGLDWGKAAGELAAAVKHLRANGAQRVGVVGFCMGGALSVIASHTAGVDAAVAFYGFPPDTSGLPKKACPPTQVFFGEREDYFPVPAAQAWARDQRARGVEDTDVVIYPGAGHAFFNDARPEAYHAASAQDAWRRTTAHFERHLR